MKLKYTFSILNYACACTNTTNKQQQQKRTRKTNNNNNNKKHECLMTYNYKKNSSNIPIYVFLH